MNKLPNLQTFAALVALVSPGYARAPAVEPVTGFAPIAGQFAGRFPPLQARQPWLTAAVVDLRVPASLRSLSGWPAPSGLAENDGVIMLPLGPRARLLEIHLVMRGCPNCVIPETGSPGADLSERGAAFEDRSVIRNPKAAALFGATALLILAAVRARITV